MNLNSIILRLIARSSDSFVAFVIALDAKLDTFLAQHDKTVSNLEDQAEEILGNAKDEVARIEAEAEKAVSGVKEQIAKATETAELIARLKGVLTK